MMDNENECRWCGADISLLRLVEGADVHFCSDVCMEEWLDDQQKQESDDRE
jgi:hypothetical protein